MKIRIIFSLLCIIFCAAAFGKKQQKLDRAAYYTAIKSSRLADVNTELTVLELAPPHEKEAFEGALLMRKAGLVAIPAEKLKLFKTGRIKLETILAKDSANAEYRFLRLIIQEHAPKIVKYKGQLETDKLYIQKHFRSLPPATQNAVADYTKTSKVLSLPTIFNNL